MAFSYLDKLGLAHFWDKIKSYFNHDKIVNLIGYTPASTSVATKTDNGLMNQLPADDDNNKFMRQDGSWQRVKLDDIPAGYLKTHPSSNGFTIPYIHNDLAFLRQKGGSYTVTFDGVEQDIDTLNADRVFDAAFRVFNVQQPGSKAEEIVFTINTPAVYKWNSQVYIDFADKSFASKHVKVEAREAGTSTWGTFYETSTLDNSYILFSKTFYSGTGIDGLRITFSDWVTPTNQFCISQIGLINYASNGVSEAYLPVAGGKMYGALDAPEIENAYLKIHPEYGSAVTLPFIFNDLAYIKYSRNGWAKVYYDGVEQEGMDTTKLFNGANDYFNISNPSSLATEITILVYTNGLFKYSNKIYLDFGTHAWSSRNIKIETSPDGETYTTRYETTSFKYNSDTQVNVWNNYGSEGFKYIRFTFSNFNNVNLRISQIGVINYETVGSKTTLLGKDGGAVYAGIYPQWSECWDLGKDNSYWRNVYAQKVTLKRDPIENMEAATKQYVDMNSGGGGGIRIALVKLAAADWSNDEQTLTGISGITPYNTVLTTPQGAGILDYVDCEVAASSQDIESITFSCTTMPTVDIVLQLIIINTQVIDYTTPSGS